MRAAIVRDLGGPKVYHCSFAEQCEYHLVDCARCCNMSLEQCLGVRQVYN
jgi:hypothetical protein